MNYTLPTGGGVLGTQCLTVAVPDDFVAVRVGFANISASPYTVPRTSAVASTMVNDGVNPTGDTQPVLLTAAHGGQDVTALVVASGAPLALTVPAAPTGWGEGHPCPVYAWTDWTPLRSASPDPVTGMRILMIRHTMNNDGQEITYVSNTYGQSTDDASDGIHGPFTHVGNRIGNYLWITGGYKNGVDNTDFSFMNPKLATFNSMVNGSIIAVVQVITRNEGVTLLTPGDSHSAGTASTASALTYGILGATAVGADRIGRVPVGFVNCAVGGFDARAMFNHLTALAPLVRPQFATIPSWTGNQLSGDRGTDQAACDMFMAYLFTVAEFCRDLSIEPWFLTPFPNTGWFTSYSPVASLPGWLSNRKQALALRDRGATVIDTASVIGAQTENEYNGCYLPGMSADLVHPSDVAHERVAAQLRSVLLGRLAGIA